ncbi:hypothetical protein [Phaffia rhodozyma]|uniref:Uncharacterized protein n=1 Tax=Phaffia rhodozyma TaxID=264483 RepID=A0A0F7STD3_PHARH|nr:hypothetical protein [Phaffia rhodozyma]
MASVRLPRADRPTPLLDRPSSALNIRQPADISRPWFAANRSNLDRPKAPVEPIRPGAHPTGVSPYSPSHSLGKKAGKPLLGWFRRLKRSSTVGVSNTIPAHQTLAAPPKTVPVRSSSHLERAANLPTVSATHVIDPGARRKIDRGGTSDYGRFVATNGIALMRNGPRAARSTRRSGEAGGNEGEEEEEEETGETGSNDYLSIATSLDPFPPSFKEPTILTSRDSYLSSSIYSTSDNQLSRFDSNASSNLTPGIANHHFGPSIVFAADEDASARAFCLSSPPSPSLSRFPSLSRVSSGSTANSTLNSTANSSTRLGRYSISMAARTETTAVTSVASSDGRISLDDMPVVITSQVAHIAQVPTSAVDPAGHSGPGPGPQTTAHRRRRSWAANSVISSTTTTSPLHLSVVASDDEADLRNDLLKLSPVIPSSRSRQGSPSRRPISRLGNSSGGGTLSAGVSRSTSYAHPVLIPLEDIQSLSPSSASSFSSLHRPTIDQLADRLTDLVDEEQSSSPMTANIESESGPTHYRPPVHSRPHVRNNPNPAAPPGDDASVLTLASSSFFSTGVLPSNGSIRTGAGVGSCTGKSGPGSIAHSLSSRRGTDRPESLSFSLSGPGGGGGGGERTGPGFLGGGASVRRRSVDTFGGPGRLGWMDDAQASVRAVRRKGSWESGESRWSAAGGGGIGLIGLTGGNTLSSSFGGPDGVDNASLWSGHRSTGVRTVDRDSLLGGQPMGAIVGNHIESDRDDHQEEEEAATDGGDGQGQDEMIRGRSAAERDEEGSTRSISGRSLSSLMFSSFDR